MPLHDGSVLIDFYPATIGSRFVDIRIISASSGPTAVRLAQGREYRAAGGLHHENHFFFKCSIPDLEPDSRYSAHLLQNNKRQAEVSFTTLREPQSKKICSFGIMPDLHISSQTVNRIDSGKRLYGKALELARTYTEKIEQAGADFIVFPGDTLDPADREGIRLFSSIKNDCAIPFYVIIGNHEGWGGDEAAFNRLFCGSPEGWYAFSKGNARFVMLSTPHQASLANGTQQHEWLKNELDEHGREKNVFLFLHFSFVLHPCVQGRKNDGMQQLANHRELLTLLRRYPGVKAVFAGHKNVPSLVTADGIAHFLSPQLIQAPCGYDIVTLYENGLIKNSHEIDEQHYVWQSRRAFGNGWQERFGTPESRNLTLCFDRVRVQTPVDGGSDTE